MVQLHRILNTSFLLLLIVSGSPVCATYYAAIHHPAVGGYLYCSIRLICVNVKDTDEKLFTLIFISKVTFVSLYKKVFCRWNDSLIWEGHNFTLVLHIIHPDSLFYYCALIGCVWLMHSLLDKTETCRFYFVLFTLSKSCLVLLWSFGQTHHKVGIFCFVTSFHHLIYSLCDHFRPHLVSLALNFFWGLTLCQNFNRKVRVKDSFHYLQLFLWMSSVSAKFKRIHRGTVVWL